MRATAHGLIVDPCIPPSWERYTVRRVHRGVQYTITIENPRHVACGVEQVFVDGVEACQTMGPRAKLLPPQTSGTAHTVRVVLGGV